MGSAAAAHYKLFRANLRLKTRFKAQFRSGLLISYPNELGP